MSQMPLLTAFIKEDGVNEMLARSIMAWTVDVPWSPLEPRGACPLCGLGHLPPGRALLWLLVSQTPLEGTAHLQFKTTGTSAPESHF